MHSKEDFLKKIIFNDACKQKLCARALRRETRLTVYPALSVQSTTKTAALLRVRGLACIWDFSWKKYFIN